MKGYELTDEACVYWGRAAEWSITEAGLLVNGIDPRLSWDAPQDLCDQIADDFNTELRRFLGTAGYLELALGADVGFDTSTRTRPRPTTWVELVSTMDIKISSRLIEAVQRAQDARLGKTQQVSQAGEIDPAELPEELDAANIAFRSVSNGFGDVESTFRNRILEFLRDKYPALSSEAMARIATVANPDKSRGRKGGTQK